jgi:hypothetical protein
VIVPAGELDRLCPGDRIGGRVAALLNSAVSGVGLASHSC